MSSNKINKKIPSSKPRLASGRLIVSIFGPFTPLKIFLYVLSIILTFIAVVMFNWVSLVELDRGSFLAKLNGTYRTREAFQIRTNGEKPLSWNIHLLSFDDDYIFELTPENTKSEFLNSGVSNVQILLPSSTVDYEILDFEDYWEGISSVNRSPSRDGGILLNIVLKPNAETFKFTMLVSDLLEKFSFSQNRLAWRLERLDEKIDSELLPNLAKQYNVTFFVREKTVIESSSQPPSDFQFLAVDGRKFLFRINPKEMQAFEVVFTDLSRKNTKETIVLYSGLLIGLSGNLFVSAWLWKKD